MIKASLVISLLSFVLLASCTETNETPTNTSSGNSSGSSSVSNNNVVASGVNCATTSNSAINYLNCLRGLAGLSSLTTDTNLQTATLNHAQYLNANNTSGHSETNGLSFFTGTTPNARAAAVSYKSSISENVSTHSNGDYKSSIEGLMSAIYHRFGFFNNEIDKIGIGEDQTTNTNIKAFVYNMSNNAVNQLCKATAFSGSGTVRFACLDALGTSDLSHGVDDTLYQVALSNIANSNPTVVKWPAENSIDVVPVFNEESPDPLPAFSVSGYPVSIEFNQHKFSSVPTVSAFTLTKVSASTPLSVITVMNKDNDPNSNFNAYQHVLFPTKRLDWATEYRADVNYNDGTEKTLSWTFTTRNLGMAVHTVSGNSPSLNGVVSGEAFAVYVPPRNDNDALFTQSATFSSNIVLDIQFIDSNTLQVTATGSGSVTLNYHGSAITFTI